MSCFWFCGPSDTRSDDPSEIIITPVVVSDWPCQALDDKWNQNDNTVETNDNMVLMTIPEECGNSSPADVPKATPKAVFASFSELSVQTDEVKDSMSVTVEKAESQKDGGQTDEVKDSISVTVEKTESQKNVGLSLDLFHGKLMRVCKVNSGLAKRYNTTVSPNEQITNKMYIAAVNGKNRNVQEMLCEFKNERTLKLNFIPAFEFAVTLSKAGDKKLGLNVHWATSMESCIVTEIKEGLVREYNEELARAGSTAKQVRVMDRIDLVNGKSGSAKELLQEVDKSVEVTFNFSRPEGH